MDFLQLFDGFFDITSRSLGVRHAREREARKRRLEEALSQNGDLAERLEALEKWIEARRQLREAQENKASLVQGDATRVMEALAHDQNRVLTDLWNTTKKADAQGHLQHSGENRELAHAN